MRPGSPAKSPTSIDSWSPAIRRQRPAAGEPAGADLRAAEILQDGDWTASGGRRVADALDRGCRGAVRAVGKIQTEDIDARRNKRANDLVAVRCRTDGGDDLRLPHSGLLDLVRSRGR